MKSLAQVGPPSRPHRFRQIRSLRGFTLIELIVVLAILATVAALALPAVLDVRESARRIHCQNNLRQLGIALNGFHDLHGKFPPGWSSIQFSDDGTTLRPADLGCLWAWAAYLLPALDQAALHDHLDVLGVADPPAPGEALDVGLSVFVCPSDAGGPESGWGLYRWDWSGNAPITSLVKGYAKSNYAAVNGSGDGPSAMADVLSGVAPPEPLSASAGIFGSDTHTRDRDIRDGLSQTLAVGEREMTRARGTERPRGALWIRNVGELTAGGRIDLAATNSLARLHDPTDSDDDDAVHPVMSIQCDANSVVGVTSRHAPLNETSFGFSSLHKGGANFLFADGSARFISETIDLSTYCNLGAMADGQVVGDF